MKKTLIIIASVIVIFFLALAVSYKMVNKGKKQETKNTSEKKEDVAIYTSSKANDKEKEENKTETKEEKITEINKNSSIALELYEFIPKSYQTYPWKLNEDYMLYEAISRLSKEENVNKENIDSVEAYKYSDVDKMIKKVYGPNAKAVKKESYTSPVEYYEAKDTFGIYPVGIDKTDNMMVIKSVEESASSYIITVYSVCVYMDMESNDTSTLYIMTKDTMKKYYSLVSRNDKSLKDTYKEYKLSSSMLNPQEIVDKYEDDLPLIQYHLTKTDDKENKYYVSDIKDIY
ncbi:MAG: hypothetical protein IJ809_00735 [Clostridia bacterium]|nr:hypothetical protein [Clostridia bacterium]